MQLKWFKGPRLPEVMEQVREEFGEEAVILHTRTGQRGLRGWLGRTRVEVLAAIDEGDAPRGPVAEPLVTLDEPTLLAESLLAEPLMPVPLVAPPPPSVLPSLAVTSSLGAACDHDIDAFAAEVADLRSLLIRFGGARALPSPLSPFYSWLLTAGIEEGLAFRLLDGLPTNGGDGRPLSVDVIGRSVEDRITSLVRVAGSPTTPRDAVLAFVGPPGSGKTMTAAKLAVRAYAAEGLTRLVSLDDVSLGAPGHLFALGAVSGVSSAMAVTPEEIRATFRRHQAGLTVIDTPGVNPRDTAAVAALAERLRLAAPTEVHLVLPATTKPDDALTAVRSLTVLGLTHVAFTRLDEAVTCGSLLTVCDAGGLPLSYVAAGRDIPNDLNPGTARGLARRVLRGEPHP